MNNRSSQTNHKSSATTLDDLAVMIKNGFDNTANKKDVEAIHTDIEVIRTDIENVKSDIAKVDEHLGVVETKLDRALYTELTHLEARLRRVEEKVGLKSHS